MNTTHYERTHCVHCDDLADWIHRESGNAVCGDCRVFYSAVDPFILNQEGEKGFWDDVYITASVEKADLIIRATDSHADLLAALEACEKELSLTVRQVDLDCVRTAETLIQARAAIARAKGEV